MLLFPQKEERASQAERVFYVISAQPERSQELASLLRLAGFPHIEVITRHITTITHLDIPTGTYGLLVDIEQDRLPEQIITALLALVPRSIWCGVVGDSDSITLAQRFADHGMRYFNLFAQRDAITEAAINGLTLSVRRNAISISILGCKGGVGSSYLAWQVANRIAQLRQVPTLMVQGAAASQDLDLLAGKKLSQEVTSVGKHLQVMFARQLQLPDLTSENFLNVNFVLFEQAIYTLTKEVQRHIAEHSACLVLVLDRSMTSIRVVRQVIELVESINRARQKSRRLLLCLNDVRPCTSEMLSQEDIEALLGRHIDILIPYQRKQAIAAATQSIQQIDLLVRLILGESPAVSSSLLKRLLPMARSRK